MNKVFIFILIVFDTVLFTSNSYAEELPRTAILPFQGINVSSNDAKVVSALFETALVQTGSFPVIEQNQMKEILEAQSVTLSGCVDEACAVEFGKLLAAEQIILGTFSSIGGKYVINAKIIDVTTGELSDISGAVLSS